MQAEKIIENTFAVIQNSGMDKSADEKPVSVRMPADLKGELAKVADKEKRSMNQTFLFIIERGLAAYMRDGKLFEPDEMTGEDKKPATITVPVIELTKKGAKKKNSA